ncbi:unnamed protein product [Heligmosomoides polygyrus]|uniref:Thyroglobulin type-1 domain-containing protein n=1 Tax=Heligmosomoides polygyrus TaxID=6339 RepID=A0A183GRX6_HELPZ|nr:unnamed protein product [Heligmosomoides polygyrus]
MAPSVLHGGFFMQLFADSGLQISCPSGMSVPSHSNSFRSEEPYMILHYSGNPVYIHPILADLQQCEQQLGAYNKSTCPGGTACERFPILVPEFQDYCCWVNKTSSGNGTVAETGSPSTSDPPSFSRRGTPDRGVVEAIVERPEPEESLGNLLVSSK